MNQVPEIARGEQEIRLIYDGDCPFCRRYVTLVRLRDNYRVQLIDARDAPDLYRDLLEAGMNLDDGMVMELQGRRYFGDECVTRLAVLSSASGSFNRLNAWVFRSPWRSRYVYPCLVLGRRLVLRLLRVQALRAVHKEP